MHPIDFYYMPESPPCRLVHMIAIMTGVSYNKKHVNLFTKEHLKEDFVRLNPRHKVPFIVDGNVKMGESRAIALYLVNNYNTSPDSFLYPADPAKRAQVDELLYFDMALYESSSKLLKPMLLGPVEALDNEAEREYRANLAYLEKRLQENGGKKFMLGDSMTIADFAFAASFTFPEACDYDISEFRRLTSYLASLKDSIPYYNIVHDEAQENMRNFIKSKQEGK